MTLGLAGAVLGALLGTSPPEPAPPVRGSIVLQIRDDDGAPADALAELVAGIRDPSGLSFRTETHPAAEARLGAAQRGCSSDALVVFWLDVTRTDEWRLYALPCATAELYVREVPVTHGAEQASIEALWLILRSSAIAIAQGGEIAMAQVDAASVEPPAKPVAKPAPAPVEPRLPSKPIARKTWARATIAYAGDGLARVVPWQSGGFVALAITPLRRLRVGASYEILAPARRRDPAGFSLLRQAVALTVAGVAPIVDRLDLEFRFGAEVELSRWRSTLAGRGHLRAIPRLGADVLFQIRLWRNLWVDLGPGVAVALVDVDFVTCAAQAASCSGADRKVVLDTWRARPRARAGLSVQF